MTATADFSRSATPIVATAELLAHGPLRCRSRHCHGRTLQEGEQLWRVTHVARERDGADDACEYVCTGCVERAGARCAVEPDPAPGWTPPPWTGSRPAGPPW